MDTRRAALTVVGLLAALHASGGAARAEVGSEPDYWYRWNGAGWTMIADYEFSLGPPQWLSPGELLVPNIPMPYWWHKDVTVEAVFAGPAPTPALTDQTVGIVGYEDVPVGFVVGPNDWTLKWSLPDQPAAEVITWSPQAPWGSTLQTSKGDAIQYMDVATSCVELVLEPLDLMKAVLSGQQEIQIGDQIEFVLTYNNPYDQTVTGVILEDELPDELAFVSATGGGTEDKNLVRWHIGTLGPNQGGQVGLTAECVAGEVCTWITNFAWIYGDDPLPTNGDSYELHIVPEPAAISLLAVGGLGVLVRRKRKRATSGS